MDEHEGECDCVGCQFRRQVEGFNQQNHAIGAAISRRSLWVDVFMKRIEAGDLPVKAANIAAMSVIEFDKAFPEVKAAAMAEDR